MVDITAIRESNRLFQDNGRSNLVAVFVGATAGIGEHSLRQFAKHARSPKVYLVGRNEASATSILNDCKASNPQGTFSFTKADCSLLSNVDRICEEIAQKENHVDLLVMSQGYLSFSGRNGIMSLSPNFTFHS